MKTLIFAISLLMLPATAMSNEFLDNTYFTVGAGYKFKESTLRFEGKEWSDPYSARFELGYKVTKNFRFGIAHHSQWVSGKPFNPGENEYHKTELFIDLTFSLSEIF